MKVIPHCGQLAGRRNAWRLQSSRLAKLKRVNFSSKSLREIDVLWIARVSFTLSRDGKHDARGRFVDYKAACGVHCSVIVKRACGMQLVYLKACRLAW